jgi:hypothetical protein
MNAILHCSIIKFERSDLSSQVLCSDNESNEYAKISHLLIASSKKKEGT